MPRVPQYGVPQVETRALPGVQQSSVASPELLSAGARQQMANGQALLQAGANLGNVASAMQDRENADMLFRAETALKDDYLKYEEELRNRKGQQAWGATNDTAKWFADQEKKHAEGLQNDVQRRLFSQSMTKMRQSAMGAVSAYEAGERRRSLEESANASIVGSINQAAAMAANGLPTTVADPGGATAATDTEGSTAATAPGVTVRANPLTGIKSDIIKRVQVLSDLNGWSPERKAAEEEKHLTNLHSQVIQNLAVKSPSKAKEYYEANKAEIAGTSYNTIESALKEGTLREVSQSFADDIQARGLSMEDALREARSKLSGDEEAAAVAEIKTRFGEAQAITAQAQQSSANAAWKVISAGGGRKQIPLQTWNGMSGQDQRHILDYLEAKARRTTAEANKTATAELDDLVNLDKVERMIEQGDITDLAGLAKYDAFFSKSTLRTLSHKIEKRAVVPPADIRRAFEERKGEKVNVGKMNTGDRSEWMAFQDYILQNVRETRRPEDIDNFADRWFMKGYGKEDSFFVNDPNTFGEARAKGRKDFLVETPETAASNVDEALSILQRAGVPIPKDRKAARDELYTNSGLAAERWAAAHGMPSSPDLVAAYALLKQNKKPTTPANLRYVMQQFADQAPKK